MTQPRRMLGCGQYDAQELCVPIPRIAFRSSTYQRLDLSTVHHEAHFSESQLAATPGMLQQFKVSVHSVFGTIRAPSTGPLSHHLQTCQA